MLISQSKAVWICGLLLTLVGQTIALPANAGQDGGDRTIFLEPRQSMSLDLSGSNGSDGADGADAYRDDDDSKHGSTSSSQCNESDITKQARNVTMSHGEAGEAGGNGGNGGDGGDLTIYYQNRSDLSQVFVNSSPGRGGTGGKGGRGSRGCKCPVSSWKIEGKTYHCTDGKRGARGSNGSPGADGTIGKLRLIAGTTPIAGDQPQVRTSFEKLAESKIIALSLNQWNERSGARSLLQFNSKINDQYSEYQGRLEKTATVQWQSKSSLSNYGSQTAAVTLKQDGKIFFGFDDQALWSVVEQVDSPKGTAVAVKEVVHQRDALKLTPGITDKRDRDFMLAVIDTGAKSDIVGTQFSVKIKSVANNGRPGSFGNETTQYEGVIPATAVKQDYNRFLLNLGSLPVPEETFKSGNDVAVEITVVRSLGTRSASQTIDWSGTVD